jgi:kynurenine 3-monooxygenase
MTAQKIHIVGGGLVGTLAAIVLAQRGFAVALYERRPDMRKVAVAAGRSINLALTARGLKALGEVGLHDEVMKFAIAMRGRMLHDAQGNTSLVPYGQKPHEVIHSVSRGDLNKLLLEKAGSYASVEIFFNQRCAGYDLASRHLTLVDEQSSREKTVIADVVIGADGGGSALRHTMSNHVKDFAMTQDTLAHGYKELVIPAAPGGGFLMEKHALHIWPRKSYMLIALPNMDGSFTVTLFLAHEGRESFAALATEADVQAFFAEIFPDAARMMPSLGKDFFHNPTGSMTTVKCLPWHVQDQLLLIGDAAHAIVPFFGQGMNAGFEDCSALGALLETHGADWKSLFPALEKMRKPNTDAIADMALENFVEMHDTVADARFQFKKQVGFELERRYPGRFIPRYAMVVFHPEIPYAEAKRRGEIQDILLEELCAGATTIEQIDWHKAAQLVGDMKF